MKTFGFLMPTPEFAKICGGGQYNGYVAISRAYLTEGQDYQHWLDDMDGVMHGGCTLDVFSGECFKNREIVPVTDIDTNWSEYMVFGFDTMHLGDTWDSRLQRKKVLLHILQKRNCLMTPKSTLYWLPQQMRFTQNLQSRHWHTVSTLSVKNLSHRQRKNLKLL